MTTSLRTPAPTRAKHCAELLGAGPSIGELVPALSRLAEKLARTLPPALARLNGGDPPVVRIGMPMDTTLASIDADIEGLASHGLLALGPQGLPVLATFEAAPVLRLVDRAFGGKGLAPEPLPEALPLSAQLLLARIEDTVGAALGEAVAQVAGGSDPVRARSVRRDSSLRQLDPFDKRADLLQIALDVEEEGAEPWSFALAFPCETLAAALAPRPAPRTAPRRAAPAPTDAPFADLPLELTAVLVDMAVPFSRLSGLKAGDVIPVSVARAVPVQINGTGLALTIATGTVGEVEDRVAVQLQTAFTN